MNFESTINGTYCWHQQIWYKYETPAPVQPMEISEMAIYTIGNNNGDTVPNNIDVFDLKEIDTPMHTFSTSSKFNT